MKTLVFDVGGTEIKSALIDEELNITNKKSVPTPLDTFENFTDVIYETYSEYKDEVDGIAISLPGFIDVENGRCNGGGALFYNHNNDVGRKLKERCNCNVILENDGKAAALAEYYHGSLKGCQNGAVFVIGTGVGGGLIIDGKPLRGKHFTAGEFSFLNVNIDDYEGMDNFLAFKCSTTFLLMTYCQRKGIENIDGREFFNRLPNDDIAKEVLDELCKNIAIQIYNLYWLLDVEKAAIGGGISNQEIVCEKINEKFNEIQETGISKYLNAKLPVEIVNCKFNNDANLIGAYVTYKNMIRKED